MTSIPTPHLVDVAIVGLGVHGSALAAELAQRGASVVGIERSTAKDVIGSSHGPVRMIQARGPGRVLDFTETHSLVDAWSDLLARAGDPEALVPRRAVSVPALIKTATANGQPLSSVEWRARRESPGQLVHAARAVIALRSLATRQGAALLFSETADFTPVFGRHPEHVLIHTGSATLHARTVIFCVGPEIVALPSCLRPRGLRVEPALSLIASLPGHQVHDDDAYYLLHRPEGEFCLIPIPGTDQIQMGHFRFLSGPPDAGPDGWQQRTAEAGRAAMARHLGLRAASNAVHQIVGYYVHTSAGGYELVRAGPHVSALSACAATGYKFAPLLATSLADVLLSDAGSNGPLQVNYRSTTRWT